MPPVRIDLAAKRDFSGPSPAARTRGSGCAAKTLSSASLT